MEVIWAAFLLESEIAMLPNTTMQSAWGLHLDYTWFLYLGNVCFNFAPMLKLIMHGKEDICSWYWLYKVGKICFIIAMLYHQMCIYNLDQPAYLQVKKTYKEKHWEMGTNPTARQVIEAASLYVVGKFWESANLVIIFFQPIPLNALRLIRSQIHYSQEKGQGGN